MRQKYIIQLWNCNLHHWFDYVTFYNQDNAKRFYQRLIKQSRGISIRLLEVICYEFKEC